MKHRTEMKGGGKAKGNKHGGRKRKRMPTQVFSTYNVRTLKMEGKFLRLVEGAAEQGIAAVGVQEHRLLCEPGRFAFVKLQTGTYLLLALLQQQVLERQLEELAF